MRGSACAAAADAWPLALKGGIPNKKYVRKEDGGDGRKMGRTLGMVGRTVPNACKCQSDKTTDKNYKKPSMKERAVFKAKMTKEKA